MWKEEIWVVAKTTPLPQKKRYISLAGLPGQHKLQNSHGSLDNSQSDVEIISFCLCIWVWMLHYTVTAYVICVTVNLWLKTFKT